MKINIHNRIAVIKITIFFILPVAYFITASHAFCQPQSNKQYVDKCGDNYYDPRVQFCDERDNRLYRFVTIGKQMWMAENIDYGNQVSGIEEQTGKNEKYCYDDDPLQCNSNGGLYTWGQALALDGIYNKKSLKTKNKAQGACPAGWHVPTSEEWNTLIKFASNEVGEKYVAGSLKTFSTDEMEIWLTDMGEENVLPKDLFGFSITPAGAKVELGECPFGHTMWCFAHARAMFWTSDEIDANHAVYYDITENVPEIIKVDSIKPEIQVGPGESEDCKKTMGLSVRCIKD